MTEVMHRSLRPKNTLYLIEKDDITFGLFLITDTAGTKIVENRIRSHMKSEETYTITAPYEVEIDLKVAFSIVTTAKMAAWFRHWNLLKKPEKKWNTTSAKAGMIRAGQIKERSDCVKTHSDRSFLSFLII